VNAPLRRVAVAVFVLFGLIFANLNYVQFVRADELRNHPLNYRVRISDYERERGAILVEDQVVAQSKPTGGRLKYQREYPAGPLYAHVTGFQSLTYGLAGIEGAENPVLSGNDDRLVFDRIAALFTGEKPRGGNVVLTLDKEVQQVAARAIGDRKGAVVALDPTTGAIQALVSVPTYNPNPFASHADGPQKKAWESLNGDPDKPMLNRALNESYPPGSTFKVVVSAALLAEGYTPDSRLESPDRYKPPQTTQQIQNFDATSCFGGNATLEQALTVSCNTTFAKAGVEVLGADKIRAQAEKFGFGNDDKLRVPMTVSPSKVGSLDDPPAVAQSSIGQRDIRMTPLQGAMIAAAVANDGVLMRPHLVKEVQAPNYSTLERTEPEEYAQPLSSGHAADLRTMMESVVSDGTGQQARISGAAVGGKTGTAEDGSRPDHSWFISYALVDGKPVAAVAVILENAGTSSSEAVVVARQVMRAMIDQGTAR